MTQPPPLPRFTAIWQSPNPHESEWIEEIFGPFLQSSVTDGQHQLVLDNAILFDAFVYCFDLKYYEQFCGKNAFLVHFLDENFEGLYDEIYRNFRGVFRCFWSDVFNEKYVMKIPLGYSNGRRRGGREIEPASRRRYLWSFGGQVMKSSRPDMVKALAPVHPHFFFAIDDVSSLRFLNSEEATPKRLPPAEFAELLFQSAFSPCPMGNVQVECYRVYEALECGSIPIVERRLTMDYFRALLGEHPIPTVRSWPEARRLVERMQRHPAEMDALQQRCMAWWDEYKQGYRRQAADFMQRRLADPEPIRESVIGKVYSIPGWRTAELLRHHDRHAAFRRVERQVARLLRQGKLRVAHRPGAR